MKALIVYGSTRGGTAGLAEMIASAFWSEGWKAEVADAATDPPIGDADIVVVGGALYINRWHRDARRWVRRHARALRDMPVWLFSSGPLDDSARAGDLAPVAGVAALAAQIEVFGHMTFGGRLEEHPKGFIASAMAKKMAGDWRDPAQVAEWVHHICRHTVVEAVIPAQRRESPVVEGHPVPAG